jgi:CO/xanthine dehydrogenase FAD-binding subunit
MRLTTSQKPAGVVEVEVSLTCVFSSRVEWAFLERISLFLRPVTLDEALQALTHTPATILSGGTDLFPAFTGPQLRGPVMDISAIDELKGVRANSDFFHIGAGTTWSELLAAPLPRGFDGLRAAAREIGSIQIQNQATIAGNICNASPAADGVAALLALDAEVTLASRSATRALPLADFIQGNRRTARQTDEILTAIRIPRRWENAASSFLKLGARRYLVISIVMVAANLLIRDDQRIREAAICVGSCSPKAIRLVELERALVGATADESLEHALRPEHFSVLSPIDDLRATAVYRREAAQTLVKRALAECVKKAS